jgi:hypothetical protein
MSYVGGDELLRQHPLVAEFVGATVRCFRARAPCTLRFARACVLALRCAHARARLAAPDAAACACPRSRTRRRRKRRHPRTGACWAWRGARGVCKTLIPRSHFWRARLVLRARARADAPACAYLRLRAAATRCRRCASRRRPSRRGLVRTHALSRAPHPHACAHPKLLTGRHTLCLPPRLRAPQRRRSLSRSPRRWRSRRGRRTPSKTRCRVRPARA